MFEPSRVRAVVASIEKRRERDVRGVKIATRIGARVVVGDAMRESKLEKRAAARVIGVLVQELLARFGATHPGAKG